MGISVNIQHNRSISNPSSSESLNWNFDCATVETITMVLAVGATGTLDFRQLSAAKIVYLELKNSSLDELVEYKVGSGTPSPLREGFVVFGYGLFSLLPNPLNEINVTNNGAVETTITLLVGFRQ